MQPESIEVMADLFRRRDVLMEELEGINRRLASYFSGAPNGNGSGEVKVTAPARPKTVLTEHPLRLYMVKHNMRGSDMADKLKCSRATVVNWLNGARPNSELKDKLTDLLGNSEMERWERLPLTKAALSSR